MVLLGVQAQVDACFSLFGDSANLDAPNVPWSQKPFWTHPMELLGDVGLVESRLIPFGDNVSVGAR